MNTAKDTILASIRKSLKRGALSADQAAHVEHRLQARRAGVIPARARRSGPGRIDLFVEEAERVSATVARVADVAGVPGAIADYLAQHNLPANLKVAPDPALKTIPWSQKPTLSVAEGRGEDSDAVSVTGAFAGVAETVTLVLLSGPEHPSTLNLLRETHIVVLRRDQVVASYEDAWALLRVVGRGMPRTVAMVTGPSRTADIEQKLLLGAHGPQRLHIVLIDGDDRR